MTGSAITALGFDELDPSLQDALRARVDRLGYLGGFFCVMGHQPRALAAFEEFTQACKESLGAELAETIALTVATALGNDYERNQHERLAVRSGLSREWVAAIEQLDPDGLVSSPLATVQRFALVAAGHHDGDSAALLDDVVAVTDEATAAAVALLVGRFVAHALVSRACRLTAPVPSIFEDGFGSSDER